MTQRGSRECRRRLIVSHYENNYGGAVNRLNAITAQLAELDFATAPGFVINGLKREELIASNSMILHELFFASLGEESAAGGRAARGARPRFRQRRSLARRILRHGQGAGRRVRAGCC